MPKPTVPSGLGKQAQAQWRKIVAEYELRIDELRVLEDACREIDLVDRIEKELKSLPSLMVTGSKNQLVVSPLVREVRQHRLTVARLLGSLNLPDDDDDQDDEESEKGGRSTQARAAASARWRSGS